VLDQEEEHIEEDEKLEENLDVDEDAGLHFPVNDADAVAEFYLPDKRMTEREGQIIVNKAVYQKENEEDHRQDLIGPL
jgi:hypothetical protein